MRTAVTFPLIIGLLACRSSMYDEPNGGARKFAHYWARVDNPARDGDPTTRLVLEAVAPKAGAWIADVGAGGGYFSFKLAAAVGPAGRVVATDLDADMVAYMRREAAVRRVPNLEARVVTEADPGLEAGAYDVLLAVNVYLFWKELPELARTTLVRMRGALRPGGRVVIEQDNVFTGESKATNCFYDACKSLSGEETAALAATLGFRVERLLKIDKPLGDGMRPGYLLVLSAAPMGGPVPRAHRPP